MYGKIEVNVVKTFKNIELLSSVWIIFNLFLEHISDGGILNKRKYFENWKFIMYMRSFSTSNAGVGVM